MFITIEYLVCCDRKEVNIVGKFSKAYHYLQDRSWELKISVKEFFSESKLKKKAYETHVKSRLLVDVHSVEKGLGLANAKPGHSGKTVISILDRLSSYKAQGNDVDDFAFKETFAVISAYMEFQEQFDTSKFDLYPAISRRYQRLCKSLGEDYVALAKEELQAGVRILNKNDLEEGRNFNFDTFIDSRHSVRSFDGNMIESDVMRECVAIANKAPSACNRQPSHVYFLNKKELVDRVDNLITGSSGFKGETPNYVIVTEDRAAFAKEEQFQWYINGGIYLSYLSLAMHSKGIGHCIMQWKAFHANEKELKSIFHISEQEAIVAVIACGYCKSEVPCICAQRKSVEDTLSIIE